MAILATINLSDIPVDMAKPLNGLAVVGNLTTRETNSGEYIQISLPLYYVPAQGNDKNAVDEITLDELASLAADVTSDETATAAGLKKFIARWLVKEEWFTPEYTNAVKNGSINGSEKMQYNINFAGLTRGLFKSLGHQSVDFESVEPGSVIGFKGSASKKEPEKVQIRAFFTAR